MFHAKVSIQRNIDGKVENIEKDFTDQSEYEKFLQENNMRTSTPDFSGFFTPNFSSPIFGYIPIQAPRTISRPKSCCRSEKAVNEALPIDLDFYESELAKTQLEKAQKEQKKQSLQTALDRLLDYKNKMKGIREDLFERIDADIKRVHDELAQIWA